METNNETERIIERRKARRHASGRGSAAFSVAVYCGPLERGLLLSLGPAGKHRAAAAILSEQLGEERVSIDVAGGGFLRRAVARRLVQQCGGGHAGDAGSAWHG